jgi:hypothetical protein
MPSGPLLKDDGEAKKAKRAKETKLHEVFALFAFFAFFCFPWFITSHTHSEKVAGHQVADKKAEADVCGFTAVSFGW